MHRDLSIPQHVAIVMDGNGRWAKKRFLPRFFGHKAGVDTLIRTIDSCADRGIRYLTVFAFSSENWNRPADEVSGLMGLVLVAQAKYMARMVGKGVRVVIAGDRAAVSERLRKAWDEVEQATKHNTRLTLTVAFNYGGRWDVVQACRRAVADGLRAEQIDDATLSRYMAMSHAPDADLFIRTGGEVRISNFLLWHAAYSELVFTDCLWPDFGEAELDAALANFAGRERRYGALPTAAAGAHAG